MPGPPKFTKSISFPSAFRVIRFRLPVSLPLTCAFFLPENCRASPAPLSLTYAVRADVPACVRTSIYNGQIAVGCRSNTSITLLSRYIHMAVSSAASPSVWLYILTGYDLPARSHSRGYFLGGPLSRPSAGAALRRLRPLRKPAARPARRRRPPGPGCPGGCRRRRSRRSSPRRRRPGRGP